MRGSRAVLVFMQVVVFLTVLVGVAFAQPRIQINGFSLDVKGQEPAVPQELDVVDTERGALPVRGGKLKKWIVQFDGPVHDSDKKLLTEAGCRIGDYLPDFAFIVSMDNKSRAKVEKLPFINGVMRLKPAY